MFDMTSRRGFAMPALIGIIVALLAVAGIGVYVSRRPAVPPGLENKMVGDTMMVDRTITLTLNEQNDSGARGTAVLTEIEGNKTKVVVNLSGAPSGVAQPSHIHTGSCVELGGVKYPLTNVMSGAAQTTFEMPLADLIKELPLAINVHKSASEANVYIACGDIIADTMMQKGTSTMMEKGGGMMDDGGMMQRKTHKIEITATGFNPATLEIAKGDTVQFINRDADLHWPASAMHPMHTAYPGSDIKKCGSAEANVIFDACRGLDQGQNWSFTFNATGSWGYHDHLRSTLWGRIIVK